VCYTRDLNVVYRLTGVNIGVAGGDKGAIHSQISSIRVSPLAFRGAVSQNKYCCWLKIKIFGPSQNIRLTTLLGVKIISQIYEDQQEAWVFPSFQKPLSLQLNEKNPRRCQTLPARFSHRFVCSQPIFLNEALTRLPQDVAPDEPVFHLSHIDHVYTLRAENVNERTAWMNKIRDAADLYIDTEKKKREKAYQGEGLMRAPLRSLAFHDTREG